MNHEILHVVGVVSNPARYKSRYALAAKWLEEMHDYPNVQVHLVESAFGSRPHHFSEGIGSVLRVRSNSEAWNKENLINLGMRYLVPRDAPYRAWVDCDVRFGVKGWAVEAMHQLQHFPILQPWQQCADLGPDGNILPHVHQSFGFTRQKGERLQRHQGEPYRHGHPGFAWCCTREWWEAVGGLMDHAILGSADDHMAWSCIGEGETSVSRGPGLAPSYMRKTLEWQTRARRIYYDVGFSVGRIEHSFHGPKARRYYRERWQILLDHKFDPDKHLGYNVDGVVQVVGNPGLEDAIRAYNRSRHEDSTEET